MKYRPGWQVLSVGSCVSQTKDGALLVVLVVEIVVLGVVEVEVGGLRVVELEVVAVENELVVDDKLIDVKVDVDLEDGSPGKTQLIS